MTRYEIEPFELTQDFEQAWAAAGRHLDLRVRDTGASWLRAELPPFREHLSFTLGNQLFFIQIMDVDHPHNGWVQNSRLQSAVTDAQGIACLMPMRKTGQEWHPVQKGWGLIDPQTLQIINPIDLVTDTPVLMTPWEIHDVGIQVVRTYLKDNGWTIASWQTDLNVDPSIFAQKGDYFCGVVVRTSNKGPDKGKRPLNAANIAELMRSRGWGAKFVGLKIAARDDPFDPMFEHLTRRIYRRSPLLFSPVEIEDLETPVEH